MRLLLDENRCEAALKQMPDSSMPAIEGLGIAPIELAHAEREIRLWGFEQEMIVIVHQTVGMAEPAVPIDDVGQEREKGGTILLIPHDVLPRIATTGDVIDGARVFDAQGAGHGREDTKRNV